MALPWFKFFHEFGVDEKVQSMSEPMQRRLVLLFCLQCAHLSLALSDKEIARYMRISAGSLAKTKALFQHLGFIGDTWELRNWVKRQSWVSTSQYRMAQKRDRDASRHNNVTHPVTEPSQQTSQISSQCDAQILKTEENTEKLPVGPPAFSDRPPRTHAPAREANGQPRELKPDPEARGRVPPEILAIQAEIDQKRRDAAKSKPDPAPSPRQS